MIRNYLLSGDSVSMISVGRKERDELCEVQPFLSYYPGLVDLAYEEQCHCRSLHAAKGLYAIDGITHGRNKIGPPIPHGKNSLEGIAMAKGSRGYRY